jgi:hypothetical protein
MSLLLSQIGAAPATPSIIAGWTDWELPWEDVQEPDTDESFVSFLPIEAAAVVIPDYIQLPTLDEEQGDDDVEIWQPQLFDPWTTRDAISAAYAENDDEDALDEDWVGFPTQENFPTVGVAPEEEQEEEDAVVEVKKKDDDDDKDDEQQQISFRHSCFFFQEAL